MTMYYDYGICKSYNRFYNILTGGRGIGKTYGAKKFVIKDFIDNGYQFVWLRRYKEELKEARDGFFSKICVEFPKHKFNVKGNKLYIDNKLAGFLMSLSVNENKKGNDSYEFVKTIIFDEYIIDNSGSFHKYLPNEITKINDLTETIARLRKDLKWYFLSNAISELNPLFIAYGITFKNSNKFINKFIYAEMCKTSDELIKAKMNTPQMQMAKLYGGKYLEYNLNTTFLNDFDNQIKVRSQNSRQLFCLFSNEMKIFIWFSKDDNSLYCSKTGDVNNSPFAIDYEQISANVPYLSSNSEKVKVLLNYCRSGNLFFEDLKIKDKIMQILYTKL